jgi:hypothetical protein
VNACSEAEGRGAGNEAPKKQDGAQHHNPFKTKKRIGEADAIERCLWVLSGSGIVY